MRASTRQADKKPLKVGEWCYVFRNTPSFRGWAGPGVLLAESPNGRSWWVSVRGRLWKVSREQLRTATPEEELGAELVFQLSREMLEKLNRPGANAYQDVTREEVPNEQELFQEEEFTRILDIQNFPQDEPQDEHQEEGSDDYTPSIGDATTEPPRTEMERKETDPNSAIDSNRPGANEELPRQGTLDAAPENMEIEEEQDSVPRGEVQPPVQIPQAVPIRVDEASHGTMRF